MSTRPGDPVTIVAGAFAGFPAVFVREAGDKVVVEVTLFGRTAEVGSRAATGARAADRARAGALPRGVRAARRDRAHEAARAVS